MKILEGALRYLNTRGEMQRGHDGGAEKILIGLRWLDVMDRIAP